MRKDDDDSLAGFDEAKRTTLRRLVTSSAFVAPVVTSFALDALSISSAQALCSNATTSTCISDRRLKKDVVRVATYASGLGLYRFKYLWGNTEYVGVMAQDLLEKRDDAVAQGADGFLRVDYARLGLEMLTYAEWRKRQGVRAAA